MTVKQSVTTRNGDRIAIVAGLRTPFAKMATYFHGVPAVDLGKMVVNELLIRNNVEASLVEQVVYGQVVQMPEAPNIAREIVLSIAESMMAGNIEVGVAGGADSTSVSPIGVSKKLARALVDLQKAKTMGQKWAIVKRLGLKDLLPVPPAVAEYSTGLSMGQTAEQMAKSHGISRQAQDELAHRSHSLAAESWNEGKLDSEVMTAYAEPFKGFLGKDNNVRFDSKLEGYAKLRPVFDKKYGSVTAANATPLTDGASAVLMMTESKAKALGYTPLGYIRSYAFAAIDVWEDMLMGPSYATPMALDRAGMTLNDLTLIEMHEAFAAQTLANVKMFASDKFAREKLGRDKATGEIDMDKFNVMGSSIAYGHPFAATGTRMITQMLNELQRRGGGSGLLTACAAGGLGAAMIVETE